LRNDRKSFVLPIHEDGQKLYRGKRHKGTLFLHSKESEAICSFFDSAHKFLDQEEAGQV
jgi:hypothetical protein